MHFSFVGSTATLELLVYKDLHGCIDSDEYSQENYNLYEPIKWKYENKDVVLVNVQARSIPSEKSWIQYLYNNEVIEPNTDYKCIKITESVYLFMIEKNTISEYKNILEEMLPINKVFKVKHKHINNFIHWIIKYDLNGYARLCLGDYVDMAAIIIDKSKPIEERLIDDIANYLEDRLDKDKSFDPYKYGAYVRNAGAEIYRNSNLKEEFSKCSYETSDIMTLLKEVHSATKKALTDFNYKIFALNVAKGLLYKKLYDIFYKDTNKIGQIYKFYYRFSSKNTKRRRYQLVEISTYVMSDNNKALINFFILLFGGNLNIGPQLYAKTKGVSFAVLEPEDLYQAYPNIKYVFDCKNNQVHAHVNGIIMYDKINAAPFEREFGEDTGSSPVIFNNFRHLYLYHVADNIKTLLRKYHDVRKILLKHNAVMVIPLIRLAVQSAQR